MYLDICLYAFLVTISIRYHLVSMMFIKFVVNECVHCDYNVADSNTLFIITGGDQLTVARSRSCKRIRSNSTRGRDRLEGLVPVVEDWHAKVSFLDVRNWYCILFYHVHVTVILCVGHLEATLQLFLRDGLWNSLSASKINQPTQCCEGSQQECDYL